MSRLAASDFSCSFFSASKDASDFGAWAPDIFVIKSKMDKDNTQQSTQEHEYSSDATDECTEECTQTTSVPSSQQSSISKSANLQFKQFPAACP